MRLVLALAAAILAAGALASPSESNDVELLARSSVDARFVPDPADKRRDMVTGQERDELERLARDYYDDLQRRDPAQFERARLRLLGSPSADDLQAVAMAELADGRPASAELAWERLIAEHPESPHAAPALVRLATSRLAAGERTSAASDLARLPELDVQLSYQAAPLMERLLDEVEADLARGKTAPTGASRVMLHQSLQSRELDRVRDLSEWTAGYSLLDDVARTLRLETSGDVMRVVKNAGADEVKLDTLVQLIPMDERKAGVETEERLRHPGELEAARAAAERRTLPKHLERFEGLSRLQQLQVLLLARTLEDLEIEDDGLRLGDTTLAARRQLGMRIESLAAPHGSSKADGQSSPEEVAVGKLARLADWNRDGKLTALRDDEGLWKPKRFAVEGDMRNAVSKPLDDDNARRVADLFEQTGLTEQALFAALVRATSSLRGPERGRVQPAQVDRLMTSLAERGRPIHDAAPHGDLKPRPGDVERDYLARLSVLRLPGEGLDDVVRRELLSEPSKVGTGALASDGRTGRLVAELASLGQRHEGAWLYEDDPPTSTSAQRTAGEKFERAQQIRGELDDIAAGMALDEIASVLVADLESQGLRFSPSDFLSLKQTIQHQDLGTLALNFDEFGNFTNLDNAILMSQPGTALGTGGPGHVAYGFGLDLMSGAPAANVGWRDEKELSDGDTTLSYHVGATAADGPADTSGVSARFRRKKVWQPEVGADASILRGLTGRGFIGLVRDVNLKHERQLAQVFQEHDEARRDSRAAFMRSVTGETAQARPAVLFTRSLGHDDAEMEHDDVAFRLLSDSYEFEKARQKSLMNRKARKVRFAGLGFSAVFFAGDAYLLAGPKFAVKDFRLFSRLVSSPSLRVQSEEAELRRIAVSTAPARGTLRRERVEVALDRGPDAKGQDRFLPRLLDHGVQVVRLPSSSREPMLLMPRDSPTDVARGPVATLVSTQPGRVGIPQAPPQEPAAPAPSFDRVSRMLQARGVPLRVEAGASPTDFVLVPSGLAAWCSQSIDLHAFEDQGLGLHVDTRGRPVLVAPDGLDGVVLDAMQVRRSITRPGEADEQWTIAFSLAPGTPAVTVVESSARRVRCEIVDGRLVGSAVIATRFRDPAGAPRKQANVIAPRDANARQRLALLREDASSRAARELPEMPAVALRPADPVDDGTISDPAALAPEFLASLRAMREQDVAEFKTRNIQHAALLARGEGASSLDEDNVALIQSLSLRTQGRLVSGEALEHAHFLLTHEGLFRADEGPVAQQVSYLEHRAVMPLQPGGPLSGAVDPVTRRLIDKAGIDETAALTVLSSRMKDRAEVAKRTGRLDAETVPAGTRIVTASWSGPVKGVQWTTATSDVQAHLLEPLSLLSNEGRYVMALGLGPDLPALTESVAGQLGGESPIEDVGPQLEDALARALASPTDERTLVAVLDGATLELTLADAPRAGALARCKNATLFPPAYGAKLGRHHEIAIAATPVMLLGSAETASRFVGDSWAGWRMLSLLAGGALAGAAHDHDDDDDNEPPDDDGEPPDDDGEEPGPPRVGGRPPVRGGARGGPEDRPDKPTEPTPEPPRGGDDRPGRGGGGGRGNPGDRPGGQPPGDNEEPPREGDTPPERGTNRPEPPDPGDRPRRPVD